MFMQNATRFVDAAPVLSRPASPARLTHALSATTLVEAERGWTPIGALRAGERLHTFDGGLRPLRRVERFEVQAGETRLVRLPGGVLGGAADIALLPGQFLLIDTWDRLDGVIALVPAEAMVGLGGAHWSGIVQATPLFQPVFDDDEVIYANGGQLLHCPGVVDAEAHEPYFTALPLHEARVLLGARLRDRPLAA